MEWVLRSPQIHSTFSNLGFVHTDGYHVNENCNTALELILHNILTEDIYLRTYRRSLSFGQNIKKDVIPLLIHAKDEKTIELLIKILVNLTIPVECLLCVDVLSKSDFGRHTIFEINNLLVSTKIAFTDNKATRVVVEFMKKNVDFEQKCKLTIEQCTNVSNSLLLLRNILHIPEEVEKSLNYNGSTHTMQNQILWNIFSQRIDKVLIKLMTIPDARNWGVTMVQLIALLYKDQHVLTLRKLLNLWLEVSLSESSEDNESNTSPADRAGSEDSSPMLTSDPTSDSSDTGGSGNCNAGSTQSQKWEPLPAPLFLTASTPEKPKSPRNSNTEITDTFNDNVSSSCVSGINSEMSAPSQTTKDKKPVISETSDCGYGTQIENQESISNSSNEDDLPSKKPVHQKPHNPKQRANTKVRTGNTPQDRKRKKIVKRGKSNIINVQGLCLKTPTDDDISNVLKAFTIDFLLKGYNSLVQTLHNEILTNLQLEIDTSHFFWLVTYFLKFATQIELDLELVSSVLSFDIVSYMTAEGVNLCEEFELGIKLDGGDLTPSVRRLHLVVTAIREFVQAIEVYKNLSHLNKNDHELLEKLQGKMCETEELRSLLVLLIRHYNPKYHSKQYLQDLIVTNHILLIFLDNAMKLPNHDCSTNMIDHMRQFATTEIMHQYGILLEDYSSNGEFVNDCIFTTMHHVGGELDSLITLFQPKILKTFTSIWKSEYEIGDEWSDLIEYVINTFVKKPNALQSTVNVRMDTESFCDDKGFTKSLNTAASVHALDISELEPERKRAGIKGNSSKEKWSEEEISSLNWTYLQCSSLPDAIGEIIKLLREDDIIKSRDSVIKELLKQNFINKEKYDKLMGGESEKNLRSLQVKKEMRDDEITKLCEHLANDGKFKFLDWVQKVLLETCYTKLHFEKKNRQLVTPVSDSKLMDFELFKTKVKDAPVMSPVSYHAIMLHQSVPLVPWNCQQAAVCKDLKFLQLLHKLGFHMPVDSGKVFIRIPNFWSAKFLYEVAGKISNIDTTKLKFTLDELSESSIIKKNTFETISANVDIKEISIKETTDNLYQVHKQKHLATMVNFTPMPGSSFTSDGEIDPNNWLKAVQKFQEYKITLNSEGMPEVDGKMDAPLADAATDAAVSVHDAEYYNHSVCETASVVSDLTHMYVSDEDDKPEHVRPDRDRCLDRDHDHDLDHPGKRPRLQYSSPF